MSLNLPYSGVTIVEVMRYAGVAQAWMLRPLRSSAIVRIAVETIVWSSAARNIPDMRPARMTTTWRCVKDDGASGATAPALLPAGVAVVMRSPDQEYGLRTCPGEREPAPLPASL